MKISTDELREATLLLLTHLEETGRREIDIDDDYYWDVPSDRRYDPYAEPKELVLGQLTDDWNTIGLMLKGESPPIALALVWLAAIMRRVGEKVVA